MPNTDQQTTKKTTAYILNEIRIAVEALLDEAALVLERVPSECVTLEIEQQGDLVLAMDDLKIVCEEGRKATSKIARKAQDHFSRTLIQEEIVPYRHPLATFSPDVASEFNVKDARALLELCKAENPGNENAALDRFSDLCRLKSERKKLCEEALTNGQPLPDGMKGFSWAKVTIRRLKKKEGGDVEGQRRGGDDF